MQSDAGDDVHNVIWAQSQYPLTVIGVANNRGQSKVSANIRNNCDLTPARVLAWAQRPVDARIAGGTQRCAAGMTAGIANQGLLAEEAMNGGNPWHHRFAGWGEGGGSCRSAALGANRG